MSNVTPSLDLTSSAVAAAHSARSEIRNLKAKLIGLQSARPEFIATNTFEEASIYDRDIADTKLAIEQAEFRVRKAEEIEAAALYRVDQQQKSQTFASLMVINTVFWAMFEDAYMKAATQLISLLDAAEAMNGQVQQANEHGRPDGVQPQHYNGIGIERIRGQLQIPSADGSYFYFYDRRQKVAFPEGADPTGDFIRSVTAKAGAIISQAAQAR